jgi:hypothetical protein
VVLVVTAVEAMVLQVALVLELLELLILAVAEAEDKELLTVALVHIMLAAQVVQELLLLDMHNRGTNGN